MPIIDSIVEIKQMLDDPTDQSVHFNLTGTPVDGRYPQIRILFNHQLWWEGLVIDQIDIAFYNVEFQQDLAAIELQYTNKMPTDTKMVDGKIVQNQCVTINWIELNGFRLSGYDLRDNSSTDYHLTADDKTAYNAIGEIGRAHV